MSLILPKLEISKSLPENTVQVNEYAIAGNLLIRKNDGILHDGVYLERNAGRPTKRMAGVCEYGPFAYKGIFLSKDYHWYIGTVDDYIIAVPTVS